jgi:hypothetical protein
MATVEVDMSSRSGGRLLAGKAMASGLLETPATVILHHWPGGRHDDADHTCVRGLQRKVADGTRVGDVARGAPADMGFARSGDCFRHRHGHRHRSRRAIRLQYGDRPGALLH